MNLELDQALRVALFDHIGRLAGVGDGTVSARELNQGLFFRGQRVPIWNQQYGIFKPALLGRDGAALTIQTSFDSPYDDRLDEADRLVYRYRGEDRSHYQNRALRRAFEAHRPLLYLIAVQPGLYRPIFPCWITDDDPDHLAVYLVADEPASLAAPDPEAERWPLKRYITREVKQRLHQDRFRYLVMRAYRSQCSMCRLRHTNLLDAAHILPDRDMRGLPEVPNGLSLCKIHHTAFDVGILGIDPDTVVHLRRDVLDEHDGPMLRHGLQELHGERLVLPRRPIDRPNRDYLAERFAKFMAA